MGTVMLALSCVFSCREDFLDQANPNASDLDRSVESESDVRSLLNGVYEALRNGDIVGESSGLYTDERSDDGGRNDNQSNAGEPFQFNDFSLLPSNSYLKRHWLGLYQAITRANFVIEAMQPVEFGSESEKAQVQAQAKFLRAYFYFHLVRKWGDIPLVVRPLRTQEEIQEHTFRSPQADVYAQIVADLTDATESPLPDQQTGASLGRVSKAAAHALLGEVYLTMGKRLDDGRQQEHLQQALRQLTAAYQLRSFNALTEIPFTDVFDVDRQSTCPEIVFSVVNIQGDQNFSSRIAANYQAIGENINSRRPGTGVGARASLDLIKDFEMGDRRKDFTVRFAEHPAANEWFVTKFRDASEAATENGFGGNDWILIRYADIILQLAEVHEALGNASEAVRYLDMVRIRAGRPSYEAMMQDASYISKYPSLKLAILHERRSELAFEHKRLFDLLRFFSTDEFVNFIQAKSQADYGIANLRNSSAKDRYFPIPLDEYRLDPERMYQNEGY